MRLTHKEKKIRLASLCSERRFQIHLLAKTGDWGTGQEQYPLLREIKNSLVNKVKELDKEILSLEKQVK